MPSSTTPSEKRILSYGTFDLLHHGHLRLLKRLSAMGSWVGIGLSTEAFNRTKGKEAMEGYETRSKALLETGMVDYVFPEDNWFQKPFDIIRLRADILAMGDDWKGRFDHLANHGVQVIYLPRTPDIDSTRLREQIRPGRNPSRSEESRK